MKSNKQSKKCGVIVSVVICLLFIPTIIINSILIIKTIINPNHLPSLFSIKPVIVLSGSMSPKFKKDDLVLIKNVDISSLKVGDIICYLTDTNNGKVAITHRINEIKTVNGNIEYVTKGDANNTIDQLTVKNNQIEGIYYKKINNLGGVAMFMQSTTGMIIFIVCPIVIYLVWDVIKRNKESKELKKELEQLKKKK